MSFFKVVAERGTWKSDLVSEAEQLWLGSDAAGGSGLGAALIAPSSSSAGLSDSRARDREAAKLRWWIAAEQGSEVAQNNLAYVLDQREFASMVAKLLFRF